MREYSSGGLLADADRVLGDQPVAVELGEAVDDALRRASGHSGPADQRPWHQPGTVEQREDGVVLVVEAGEGGGAVELVGRADLDDAVQVREVAEAVGRRRVGCVSRWRGCWASDDPPDGAVGEVRLLGRGLVVDLDLMSGCAAGRLVCRRGGVLGAVVDRRDPWLARRSSGRRRGVWLRVRCVVCVAPAVKGGGVGAGGDVPAVRVGVPARSQLLGRVLLLVGTARYSRGAWPGEALRVGPTPLPAALARGGWVSRVESSWSG